MHGFRDNEVLLQAWYDVIVISTPRVAAGNFSWRILKERPWLLIAFHYSITTFYLGCMVSEITGFDFKYDVTVISLLGAFQAIFHDGIWKSDHAFLSVVNGNFCPHSNGLEVIQHLTLWDFPTGSEILVFWGKMTPKSKNIEKHFLARSKYSHFQYKKIAWPSKMKTSHAIPNV